MTYKWNFEIKKGENSSEENWENVCNIKQAHWTGINRSGRPTASTIKDDHRLKMTVLKENVCWLQKTFFPQIFDKNTISFTVQDCINLEKEFLITVLNKHFLIPFKTVILSLWSSFIMEALKWLELIFLFNVPLITNLYPILFTVEVDVFSISIFTIAKIHF